MTRSATKPARPARCGFSPACRLHRHGPPHNTSFTAVWNGKPARERDGTIKHFPSEALARAWLAAADATDGASFRHQCS